MMFMLSLRYAFSQTAHHRASSIRIMVTTALSLSMVVVILSVMNYLQNERFSSIRSVRSFDLVVDGRHRNELSSMYPEASIFEYGESEALIEGNGFFIRYIDDNYNGGIRLLVGNTDGLTIPYSLFQRNISSLKVTMLREGRSGVVLPRTMDLDISGIYSSQMGYEFDSTMAFIPLSLADNSVLIKTAIKGVSIKEERVLENLGYDVTTWKEAESGLYSAFLIEKTMMYMVLALLFLIIGVSTKQSVRIFYREKRSERAELEVLGLAPKKIHLSFMLSFLLVFFLGVILALVLSLCLLPAIEDIGSRYISLFMKLSFPWFSFISFSAFLFILVILFANQERKKDRALDLVEVIYGR